QRAAYGRRSARFGRRVRLADGGQLGLEPLELTLEGRARLLGAAEVVGLPDTLEPARRLGRRTCGEGGECALQGMGGPGEGTALASYPSISGICTSITTTSNRSRSSARTACRPSSTATTVWPRFWRSRMATLRFTALSSARSTWSGVRLVATTGRGEGSRRDPWQIAWIVSSRCEATTGFVR